MRTSSIYVNKTIEKLNKNRGIPKVNLPAIARRDERFMGCWEADPDCIFVSSDFTSLEPSITAHFSQDEYYMYATYGGIGKRPFIDDRGVLMIDDIYLMTASVLPGMSSQIISYFAKPENLDKWLQDPEIIKNDPLIKPLRKKAKPACLGFNYGMGPKRFVSQSYEAGTTVNLDDARAMYKEYWKLFKDIRVLTQKLEIHIKKHGFIDNPFGYRLSTEPHKGYNAYIQSSASGVLDILNLYFFDACPWAKLIAIIHDEILYQIPINKIEETLKIQNECVDKLNKALGFSIPMRLGFTTGKTFAEIK
jgi:hypothetical protein